jgi:hypothetical protein
MLTHGGSVAVRCAPTVRMDHVPRGDIVVSRELECHKLINVLKKFKRVQKPSQTDAISRELDKVIAESKRDRLARRANERFLRSRIEISDVYGKLIE